jgi:phosphoribosylformimino-5-aminoimidazole carboxamide ribotide isomerase
MQVIPAVDVLEGRAVRLLRGEYDQVTYYADDPTEAVRMWADQGAELVHVVDLGGARDGSFNRDLVARLGSLEIAIQYGGGIRTVEAAAHVLEAGISRVVAGSVLLSDGAERFVAGIPISAIVAAIDVRGGRARGSGWRDEGIDADRALGRITQLGVTTVLATGIETDGTMSGPDLALLRRFRSAAPGSRLIASGGVGSLDDLDAVAAVGADAVIVGRALYEGRFRLAEAIRHASIE